MARLRHIITTTVIETISSPLGPSWAAWPWRWMKVLGPSVTSVTTYQSSRRSIPADVLNLTILLSYMQGWFFCAKWPKAFSLSRNVLLSSLFHVQNQHCQTSPSSKFLPQNCVLCCEEHSEYTSSLSFIISQHENVFGAIFKRHVLFDIPSQIELYYPIHILLLKIIHFHVLINNSHNKKHEC
jgi:hypothetical protein